ncbi:MAG: glycosyltransferase, partial [Deltaproteobacteria bacterium]|nr:glycosyltransferase [Deltaproteobacteria bacterium]
MEPLVSVVVPTSPAHNCQTYIGACLEALARQTFPRQRMDVVVVVDDKRGPRFNTTTTDFRVLAPRRRIGSPAVYLHGLAAAKGALVAFTDADCVPHPTWLEMLVQGLGGDRVAGCGGRIVEQSDGREHDNRLYDDRYILPCIGFANVVYRRSALDEVDLLDPNLCFAAEEFDLCWRLHLKGYRIAYTPLAQVEHRTHRPARKFLSYGVALRYLVRKYGHLFDISLRSEFRQMITFNRRLRGRNQTTPLLHKLRPLAAVAGYAWARAAEVVGLAPAIE